MEGSVLTQRTLSKSDFMLARTCDAKLWLRENGFPDRRRYDPYLQLLAEGGFMVQALVEAKHPEGLALSGGRDVAEDGERTLDLLRRDRVTLFQPTLLWNRRLARADILEKDGSTVRLIEVKAKSFDGAAHRKSLEDGALGAFRSSFKPYPVLEDWRPKIEDVAYQVLLLERLLPGVIVRPFLALVDKSKRSSLDEVPRRFELVRREGGDRDGQAHAARFIGSADDLAALDLITEVDVSAEVDLLRADVEAAATRYERMLDAPFDPRAARHGARCTECEFHTDDPAVPSGFAHCWGALARVEPHVLDLASIGRVKDEDGTPLVEALVRAGKASLYDIPVELLAKKDGTVGPQAERQRLQIEFTRTGRTFLGPGLREKIASLDYPLHFIDFEFARLALPYHAGMRPYGQIVFQWSCHTVASPGAVPIHREWLNTTQLWPNHAFLFALGEAIGDGGTVLTWSKSENSTLAEIVREAPRFDAAASDQVRGIAEAITRRTVDLNAWARKEFFHPRMGGRTSIKVVLDALWSADAEMREQFTAWTGTAATAEDPYQALPALEIHGEVQDVREGTGAIRAYEAMMYGVEKDDAAAKEAWCALLRQYCALDTLSMVLVFESWRRAAE